MFRRLLCLGLGVGLAGCIGSGTPPAKAPTVVHEITCPLADPPEIPNLPPRPDDARELQPDRYVIEGLWAGIKTRQDAYQESRENCKKD